MSTGLRWSGLCVAIALASAPSSHANPSFATGNANSCREGCHVDVQTDRMAVVDFDTTLDLGTQLDGRMRGPLPTFQTLAGQTVTLSLEVLNGSDVFAVQFKRLEFSGQRDSTDHFLVWEDANTLANAWTRQEVTNPPYFTKDNGTNGGLDGSEAGVFTFDLFVDETTPPDVYDLEFAVAGVFATEWYQDRHFYVEVVPEPETVPGIAAAGLALLALGEARPRTRRRRATR